MEYIKTDEKKLISNFILSLEDIDNKKSIDKEFKRICNQIRELGGGEEYLVQLRDLLRLIDITSYYEGILTGAHLHKILNK